MPDNKLNLIVVVNGTPEPVEVNVHGPVRTIIVKALEGHAGRPPEDWELRDEKGNLLDPSRKIEEYNLQENTTLFLSLNAGAAGAL
jgi:hypothetical protein